jgi:hypothetical protein
LDKEGKLVDGFLKSADDGVRYFEARRDWRATRADRDFREARERLLGKEASAGGNGNWSLRDAAEGATRGREQDVNKTADPRRRLERSLSSRGLRRAMM